MQQRVFAEQALGQIGQKTQQPRAFQDPAAQRVDDGHRPTALRLHQTHHTEPGIGAQIQRVGVVRIDPAQNHVDALQRSQRAHPQLAVAHHQIRAFHQRKAQQGGQIRLIEGGLRVDARAEHHDHRVLGDVGCRVDQRQPQRLRERCRRPRRDPLVEVRNRVRDNASVGQRVARARRRLRPVGVDLKAAVRQPAEVTGVHEELVAPGDLDPVGGAHVTGVGEHQFRWQDAFGDQAARPVQVGEHGIEQPGPLHQPGLQHLPICRGDHDRQGVQAPGPRLRGLGLGPAVPGGIDLGVGDAVVVDQAVHHRAQPVQPGPAALRDGVRQLGPGRPHVSVAVDEFVVADPRAVPQIEKRFLGSRGPVPGQQAVGVVATGGDRGRSARVMCQFRGRHYCCTVRTRRRSRMPGAPTSVNSLACFSRMADRSILPGVKPVASKRRARRDSAATALTGGSS